MRTIDIWARIMEIIEIEIMNSNNNVMKVQKNQMDHIVRYLFISSIGIIYGGGLEKLKIKIGKRNLRESGLEGKEDTLLM